MTIQQCDRNRDNIMTCLKVSTLALTEHVLKEYFGCLRAEWCILIESPVALSVTVRTTRTRQLFRIHPNSRQPALMIQLAEALAEVNRREIKRGQRLLVFELAEGGGGASWQWIEFLSADRRSWLKRALTSPQPHGEYPPRGVEGVSMSPL
jgi:hypothetical protein